MNDNLYEQLDLQLEDMAKGMTSLNPDMIYLKELNLNSKIFLLLLILGFVMVFLAVLL